MFLSYSLRVMQTLVAIIHTAVSRGTTNQLDEMSHQFTVIFQGDEAELDNSFEVAIMELLKEDVNMLIRDDSSTELTPQLSRQAANMNSMGSSFIGGPVTSVSSNPRLWTVNPELEKLSLL